LFDSFHKLSSKGTSKTAQTLRYFTQQKGMHWELTIKTIIFIFPCRKLHGDRYSLNQDLTMPKCQQDCWVLHRPSAGNAVAPWSSAGTKGQTLKVHKYLSAEHPKIPTKKNISKNGV